MNLSEEKGEFSRAARRTQLGEEGNRMSVEEREKIGEGYGTT